MDIQFIIEETLKEDLGSGDITTNAIMKSIGKDDVEVSSYILAKKDGVLCGMEIAKSVFLLLDPKIRFEGRKDGGEIRDKEKIANIKGSARAILAGERTALNFLARLSGIATLTRKFVKEIEGTGVKILDTRKTTPLLRELEKYAVRIGGGENHRMGLYDAILIKDNHLKIIGKLKNLNLNKPFEVEVKTLDEFKNALNLKNAKRIMLDNMDIKDIKEAVEIKNRLQITDCRLQVAGYRLPELEVSGGVKIENVRQIAETGVDYISVGAITHSAPSLDMSLEIES